MAAVGIGILYKFSFFSHLNDALARPLGWTITSVGGALALTPIFVKGVHGKDIQSNLGSLEIPPKAVVTPTKAVAIPLEGATEETFRHLTQDEINEMFPNVEGFFEKVYRIPQTIYMGTARTPVILSESVGEGGSKVAFQYSENEVILLPNCPLPNWQRMVDEEVMISERLTQLDIPNVQSKKVNVYFEGAPHPLIAYTCPSFKGLEQKGMFVIDTKGRPDLSPVAHEPIFKEDKDRSSVEAWLPLIKPLIADLVLAARHDCLFGPDSWNGVVVKHEDGTYQLRYFGFDFSSKYEAMENPKSNSNIALQVEAATRNIVDGLMRALKIPNRDQLLDSILDYAKKSGVAFS